MAYLTEENARTTKRPSPSVVAGNPMPSKVKPAEGGEESRGLPIKMRGHLLNQQNAGVLGIAAPYLDKRVLRNFGFLGQGNNPLTVKPLQSL